ncbi:MBL fold metallo-hydrolase [Streptomyces sp. NPDC002520]
MSVRGNVRVERFVTSAKFRLDGETFDVDHDVWLIGDDAEVPAVDAAPELSLLTVAGLEVHVLHTPGHTWGSRCLHAPFLNAVFTGGTLFRGGPNVTGRSCSDRPTIEASVRDRLLTLPGDTVVRTGHGQDLTIAAERPHVPTA